MILKNGKKISTAITWRIKKYLPPSWKGWLRDARTGLQHRTHAWRYGNRVRSELGRILQATRQRQGIVVFFSACDWHFPHFQRPQQLALAWAKKNFLIFYLTRNLFDRVRGLEKINDYLYLVSSPQLLHSLADVTLFIDYAPLRRFTKPLRTANVVYDFSDTPEVHEWFYDHRYRVAHQNLLRSASLVTATSDELVRQARNMARVVAQVPNGVDVDHFAQGRQQPTPADLAPVIQRGNPIVGYYGAYDWVDFELLKYLARSDPRLNFVLIGDDFYGALRPHNLAALPNIFLLGAKEYRQLPAYASRFTVAIIPFRVGSVAQATSPVKLFEYLAAGIPVVATDMPECRKIAGVMIGRSPAEFLDYVHRAIELSRQTGSAERCRAESRKHTWDLRVNTILAALAERRPATVGAPSI